jgi:hypothetical protein
MGLQNTKRIEPQRRYLCFKARIYVNGLGMIVNFYLDQKQHWFDQR